MKRLNLEELNELAIVVNDETPANFNIIGGMKTKDGKECVVLNDIPALDIGKDEYEIFQMIKEDGRVVIKSIEDISEYEKLVQLWEGGTDTDKEECNNEDQFSPRND